MYSLTLFIVLDSRLCQNCDRLVVLLILAQKIPNSIISMFFCG